MKRAAMMMMLLITTPAFARGKPAARRPSPTTAVKPHAVPDAPAPATPAAAKAPAKPKVYNFSGLDVEGKLKTPQLLYFFDRVKLELDTTTEPKRSFIKELEDSASDKGL
jgi:hypothetical protein